MDSLSLFDNSSDRIGSNATSVVSSKYLEVAILSPIRSPTILDDPVILSRLLSIADHKHSMVEGSLGTAKERVEYTRMVELQPPGIKAYTHRTYLHQLVGQLVLFAGQGHPSRNRGPFGDVLPTRVELFAPRREQPFPTPVLVIALGRTGPALVLVRVLESDAVGIVLFGGESSCLGHILEGQVGPSPEDSTVGMLVRRVDSSITF